MDRRLLTSAVVIHGGACLVAFMALGSPTPFSDEEAASTHLRTSIVRASTRSEVLKIRRDAVMVMHADAEPEANADSWMQMSFRSTPTALEVR